LSKLRWDPYILTKNEQFLRFWRTHLAARDRNVALVAGLGFDSRACLISQRILDAGGNGARDLWLICYEHGQIDAEALKPLVDKNDEAFQTAFKGRGAIHRLPLNMRGESGRLISGPATLRLMRGKPEILRYDDIIIDISAMPRMIAMTVASYFIGELDARRNAGEKTPNLHIGVAESAALDMEVAEEGLEEEVVNVPGFTGRIKAESIDNPKVWLPVLGEGQRIRLQRIYDKLQPDEICPVIPFPSRDPRRGDRLIEEYRQILFDEYRVDPRNIAYASEFNPFEAYRRIFKTVARYRDALGELGSCRAVISPLSSKLLSVGALLAACDLQQNRTGQFHVGMHYVEAGSYRPPASAGVVESDLSGLWIFGEWEA
jgi:hypothetical protein